MKQRSHPHRLSLFYRLSAGCVIILLSACSSTWKAPVSVRSQAPYGTTATASQPAAAKISGEFYRVRQGDTLYSIAWRTGRDWKMLAEWNNLDSPHRIYTGQLLRLKPHSQSLADTKPVTQQVKPAVSATDRQKKSSSTAVTSSTPSTSAATSDGQQFKQKLAWHWPVTGRLLKTYKQGDVTRKGIVVSGTNASPVRAAEGGKVVYSGSGLIGYGQLVIIKHNNKYLSAYGYNSELLVAESDWVTKGTKIALMGTNENGQPALHFEIRRNGDPINPLSVLPRR